MNFFFAQSNDSVVDEHFSYQLLLALKYLLFVAAIADIAFISYYLIFFRRFVH